MTAIRHNEEKDSSTAEIATSKDETTTKNAPSISNATTTAATTTTTTETRPPNALETASLFSKVTFSFGYNLLKLGMQRPLTEADLPELAQVDTSAANHDFMEKLWTTEVERAAKLNTRPNLHRAIMMDFLRSLWFVQPLMCSSLAARTIQAVALGYLIETFDEGTSDGWLWAGVLVACGIVLLFEHHTVFFITWRKGMQLRAACVAAIYAKSLRLKSTANKGASMSSGKIVNIATNDVERFLMSALFISYLFWAPLQGIAITLLGWQIFGPAFCVGCGLLFVVYVPLQFYLSHRFGQLRSKVAAITDERVTLVAQAVAGARVMKMSAWEEEFQARIAAIRAREVAQIQKANRLKALNETVFFSANIIISIVIFWVHVATGGELTPRNVYTTFTLINVIQIDMTKHFSLAVMSGSECYVSISRIQNFLEFPELPRLSPSEIMLKSNNNESSTILALSNVTCYWNEDNSKVSATAMTGGNKTANPLPSPEEEEDADSSSSSITLDDGTNSNTNSNSDIYVAVSNVNVEFHRNEITCIIGTVGSGKSALLQVLAGELPPSQGSIRRGSSGSASTAHASIAYAAQDPWIMNGTVQENIQMGLPMKEEWYRKVLTACGLDVDCKQLRDGDQTVVGDRGVQCSGGQRARIGLARALYRDSDVLLLDDPLSAVDAKVSRLIFYSAIMDLAVKRGKCVVLATHQHQFIGESRCILIKNGRIACDGSYSDCVAASGGKLTKTMHAAKHEGEYEDNNDKAYDNSESGSDVSSTKTDTSALFEVEESKDLSGTRHPDALTSSSPVEDERKEINITGLVRTDTFMNYARAMGSLWIGMLFLLLFIITQGSVLVSIAFAGKWAKEPIEKQDDWNVMGPVIGLAGSVFVLALIRALSSFALTVKASRTLHDRMTRSVLRAKIEFFDTNPLGRILNRFSADVGSNDDLLPNTLFDFLVISFLVVGAIVTTVSVMPFTLIPMPFLLWYFWRVRTIFVTTTRELKRLEGMARSPIFAMISESLSGIATIRTNDAVDYFRQKFEHVHDGHTRAFFSFVTASRWVGFRMDYIMYLFIWTASFLSVLFNSQDWFNVDPAYLGLSLTMLLQLGGLFQWCIRQSAEVINLMVAVERVLQFGDLPSEAALVCEGDQKYNTNNKDDNNNNNNNDNTALTTWPQGGSLEVRDLTVRYRSTLPPSLHGVSFSVEPGCRIGVVGRTGSGKSTLVQALFRLLEPEQGSIHVDGVDISTLGLHTLRSKISVIPQSPVLFSGVSVRDNLDPFHAHSQQEIRSALENVHMIQAIDELPLGMDHVVAEGGSNFSVGQRQLLCLARACLRKNRIVVLDEPTANVDSRTDQLLQQALMSTTTRTTTTTTTNHHHDENNNNNNINNNNNNSYFAGATILAVAHRLDTVIDYDRILVLGDGNVLEYGSPYDLLHLSSTTTTTTTTRTTTTGHFQSLVNDTGERMSRELRERVLRRHREQLRILEKTK